MKKHITAVFMGLMFVVPVLTFAGGGFDPAQVQNYSNPTGAYITSTTSGIGAVNNTRPGMYDDALLASAGEATGVLSPTMKVTSGVLVVIILGFLIWGAYSAWEKNRIV